MKSIRAYTNTQEWDAGHRLTVVTATVGGVTRFFYDGDGTRVQQVHASGTTLYLGAVELTISPTGRITRTYYFVNGQRIALREQRSDGMVVYFLHADALGSASLVTGLTGTVLSSLRYTPYGLPRGETGRLPTPYRYTGQRDTGVGFYDYQARLYDPAVGRFVQADTVVPEAGKSQSLNRYSYVYNNPLKYTDPTGNFTDDELEALLGENWKELMDLWYKEDYLWYALLKNGLHEGWTLYNDSRKITFAGSGKDIKASGNLLEWQNIEAYRVEDDHGQDWTDDYFDGQESAGGGGRLEHGFIVRPKIDYSGEVPSVMGYYVVRQRMGDLQGGTTTGFILKEGFGWSNNAVVITELTVAAVVIPLSLPAAVAWFAFDALMGTGFATVKAPKNYSVGPLEPTKFGAVQAAYPIFGPPDIHYYFQR